MTKSDFLNSVLHLYQGQKCTIISDETGDYEIGGVYIISANLFKHIVEDGTTIIHHLRAMDSLTDVEALKLIQIGYSTEMWDVIEIIDISSSHIDFIDGTKWHGGGVSEYNEFVLYFNQLSPDQFVYLLFLGIWLWSEEFFEEGLIHKI